MAKRNIFDRSANILDRSNGVPQFTTNTSLVSPVLPLWPGAEAFGEGLATVDGALALSAPGSITRVGGPERSPTSAAIACLFGDSLAGSHGQNYGITAYRKAGGTAVLSAQTAAITVNSLIYVAATSDLPAEYRGYKRVTAVSGTEVSFAAADNGTESGTIPGGRGIIHLVAPAASGKLNKGFFHWASALGGYLYTLPAAYNFGVPGSSYVSASKGGNNGLVDRIAAHWGTMDTKPTLALFAGATNDVTFIGQGLAQFSDSQQAAIACWEYAALMGALPVVHCVPPSGTVDHNQIALRWNTWLLEFEKKYRTIFVVDGSRRFADRLSAVGAAKAGYTSDGTHPTGKGAKVLGSQYALDLSKILRATSAEPKSLADAYHATNNPQGCVLLAKTTAGIFATEFADTPITATTFATAQSLGGWLFYKSAGGLGSISAKVVPLTDTYENGTLVQGNELIITFTGTAITDILAVELPGASWYHALLTNNDHVFAEFKYEVKNLVSVTALKNPQCSIIINDGIAQASPSTIGYADEIDTVPFTATDRTNVLKIQGTTPNKGSMLFNLWAPTGSCEIRIKYATVRKLPSGFELPW